MLLRIISISLCIAHVIGWNLTIEPPRLSAFRAKQERYILITLQSSQSSKENISLTCSNEAICTITPNESFLVFSQNNSFTQTLNVSVEGKFIGITKLNLKIGNQTFHNYEIRIQRSDWEHQKAKIFITMLVIFIPTVTFMMGTQLKLKNIKEIWKRPFSPCISLFCQFGIMPLIAYCLAKYILEEEGRAIQLALFAAGTCPGGGKSSFWTIIFGGNLDLSVSLTFAQNFFALIAMPIWIGTLGKEFTTESLRIPFGDIVEALVILLIPTVLGMIFIHYKANLYSDIQKLVKIIVWIGTFFFFLTSIYANFYIVFLLNWRIVLAGCLLPWSGYLMAFIVATILGMEFKDKITISIETGIQHVSIAMVILVLTFPEPEVDLAMVILFVTVLMTDKPLLFFYFLLRVYRRFNPLKEEKKENGEINNGSTDITPKDSFTDISLIDDSKKTVQQTDESLGNQKNEVKGE
ncbi:unnamed protein product, partial [Mesorhabditis belari]|uniref:Uncharacterized protein n=1 Tax=Mesorhabditis belari TaxID=2138241 RepID=A0AAF3F933_9BILA